MAQFTHMILSTQNQQPHRLPRWRALLPQTREVNPNTILLENGDSLQGTPVVYYYNFEKTDGPHIWSQAVNYLGFDAVGVGNHDIEAGHTVYDKVFEEIQAPIVCANAVKPDGTPYFTPYTVVEKMASRLPFSA